MTERPPDVAAADAEADRIGSPGTPRWVKVFGVLTLLAAFVFVILILVGGHHGPGRHFRSGTPDGQGAARSEPR